MNQHRWTCFTTIFLTTVLLPIATVHAKTSSSALLESSGRNSSLPLASLPTITPLKVTELNTDEAVPMAAKQVPLVSKLPMIPLTEAQQIAPKTATKIPQLPSPQVVETTPVFNPNFQVANSIATNHPQLNSASDSETSIAASIPQQPKASTFKIHQVGKPIPTIGSKGSRSTIIASVTAEAEIASELQPVPVVPKLDTTLLKKLPRRVGTPLRQTELATVLQPVPTVTKIDDAPLGKLPQRVSVAANKSEINGSPQSAPTITRIEERADVPSFEAGLPTIAFNIQPPTQIVATAIAQVDDRTVAPEPSIAIPVEPPKQSTIPEQVPNLDPTPEIVKIEQPTETVKPVLDKIVATQTGKASWYGREGGLMTANGERYNPNGLTAAHRTLPFGTQVRVTSLKTGKAVVVRINDRGPFHSQRIIDVSAGAAEVIGIKSDGIANVRIEVLANKS